MDAKKSSPTKRRVLKRVGKKVTLTLTSKLQVISPSDTNIASLETPKKSKGKERAETAPVDVVGE
jgi:hypothetical protein